MKYERFEWYGESEGLNSKEDYVQFINIFKEENGKFEYKFKHNPKTYKHENNLMLKHINKEWLSDGPFEKIRFVPA